MQIASPKDFWAGVLFGAFGLFATVYATMNYNLGTAVRMGPGYFPTWVGAMVAVLGLILAIRSLRVKGPGLSRLHWRPTLFILGGSVAYGYALKPLGLLVSTVLVVLITAAGGHEFRWRETLVGDPTVLLTRPISAGFLIASVLVLVLLALPVLRRKREEVFAERGDEAPTPQPR